MTHNTLFRTGLFRNGLRRSLLAAAVGTAVAGMTLSTSAVAQERELLNSSYDIARELFRPSTLSSRLGGRKSTAKRSVSTSLTEAPRLRHGPFCRVCAPM